MPITKIKNNKLYCQATTKEGRPCAVTQYRESVYCFIHIHDEEAQERVATLPRLERTVCGQVTKKGTACQRLVSAGHHACKLHRDPAVVAANRAHAERKASPKEQCRGLTKKEHGMRCKRLVPECDGFLCFQHRPNGTMTSVPCREGTVSPVIQVERTLDIETKTKGLLCGSVPTQSSIAVRCRAATKSGKQCKRETKYLHGFCAQHAQMVDEHAVAEVSIGRSGSIPAPVPVF